MNVTTLLLIVVAVLGNVVNVVNSSNWNEPHNHQGKVTPFEPGDPNVKLDGKALQILGGGKPYMTQIQSGSGGRGLVVQDISAPTTTVWDRILDYDNYANMVPKTVESKNYNVIKHTPTKKNPLAQTIYTRMKVGFPMIKLEFFVKHLYFPSLNCLTWTLDYTKKSDFDDSVGYWFVIPHPDSPSDKTRVYYSVEVSMFDWIPGFVVDFMRSKALTDATGWVKKYSELEWSKEVEKDPSKATAAAGMASSSDSDGGGTNNLFDFLNFAKRKREKERKEAEAKAAAELAAEEERIALEKAQMEKEGMRIMGVQLSMKRFVLIGLVVSLTVYNIHLWLQQ